MASTYPRFIPLAPSLFLQASYAVQGFIDAFAWRTVALLAFRDAKIRSSLVKSLLLNSSCLVLLYLAVDHNGLFHVRSLYRLVWILPVLAVSFYLNSSWSSQVAWRTYALQNSNRPAMTPSTTYSGVLTAIATSAYRAIMLFNSVVLSLTLQFIPKVGPVAAFVFLCWVDAYYCFEFGWIARGVNLSRRVRHVEERWAYHLAFGLPITAACSFASSLTNAVVFALLFPLYIIMAMHARPIPEDPYSPLPPGLRGSDDVVRHPSPFIPIRVPIFRAVLWLNDIIVRAVSVGGGRRPSRHSRTFSDGGESVEAGAQDASLASQHANRINIGRRGKKLD
ncbi:hypothetical protein MKEN_01175500 [Mycena kentingensis (nom. inval.)]|nr:hypothetical protein MKEN_01175500 [Mycena kentingensis (nom. inval.)]